MSKSRKRPAREDQLSQLMGEIDGSIIDADTFLGLVENPIAVKETTHAMLIGYFLKNTGERVIRLAQQADDIQLDLSRHIGAVSEPPGDEMSSQQSSRGESA